MVTDDDVQCLLRAARHRDASAFGAFYDRHAPFVFGLCMKMLSRREEAEDALQDVFLQAWRDASRFNPSIGSPGAWLTVIARSRCLDRLRRRSVRDARETALDVETEDGAWELPIASGEKPVLDALATEESRTAARRALDGLPPDQRAALEESFYGGLSQSEIAAKLGAPLGTIKTRMRLGLQKLAEALR
jgi:RNA polymerase sigma-70 factor, ECF subfamily